jgi:hypothetical protein
MLAARWGDDSGPARPLVSGAGTICIVNAFGYGCALKTALCSGLGPSRSMTVCLVAVLRTALSSSMAA